MKHLYKFKKFNEVRLSDVLNIKSSKDDNVSSEIQRLKDVTFDFDKNLVKFITLKKRVNNKKVQFKINWNDTSKHDLKKRISDRTTFRTVEEFNNFFRETVNIIFPDYLGKDVLNSGRYSIYSIEYNISIIFEFNLEKWIKNEYEINIITVLPGRKGQDVIKIIDI
jgi:hypothetical protein